VLHPDNAPDGGKALVRPGYGERFPLSALEDSSRSREEPNNGGEANVGYICNGTTGNVHGNRSASQTFLLETGVAGVGHILAAVGRFGGRAGTRAAVALSLPRG
jgi:hypothetical protein